MFWSDGAVYQTYLGLVWDGAGRAAVGIDHDSKTVYESRVMHEFMEFRNFADAGIRVGHHQKLASAEMLFSNLSFLGNRNGVAFLSWNDYNNVFEGCQFSGNDCAIRVEKGNVTVRNTRFESSRDCDLLLTTQSHSARRCVSLGSRAFIRTIRGAPANAPVRVEDCRVDGWTDPGGAVIAGLRGPIVIFDTTFTNPPDSGPPIRLDNPRYMNQIAILSNVTSPGTKNVIDSGPNGIVRWIPKGSRSTPLVSLGQRFLRDSYPTATRVVDVKRDFMAKGDGSTDDTLAIQRALDATHRLGAGTAVYFPSGTYRISETLQVRSGAAYRLEGTGRRSQILLTNPHERVALHIDSPNGLQVQRLSVGGPPGTTTILHTASGASRAHYHNVFGYIHGERRDVYIVFDSLPTGAVVTSGHLDGRIVVRNSSRATILLGFVVSVQTTVEGASTQAGFLGILSRASALDPFPLIVRDNQSVIITDWYAEKASHLSLIEGAAGRTGRVLIDRTDGANAAPVFMETNGYRGLVAEVGGSFGVAGRDRPHLIQVRKGENLNLVFIGNMFWFNPPRIEGSVARLVMLGNSVSGGILKRNTVVPDRWSPADGTLCATVLKGFQSMGALDLQLNYDYTPS